MSAFENWFIAQHGEPPEGPTSEELRGCVVMGRVAQEILQARELWDTRRESALYAWTAKETVSGS